MKLYDVVVEVIGQDATVIVGNVPKAEADAGCRAVTALWLHLQRTKQTSRIAMFSVMECK